MKLQISQLPSNHHKEMVTACCWTPSNELYTCSDDQTIVKWSMDGEVVGKVTQVDIYATAIHWFPSIGKQASDIFVVGCTDGTFLLLTKSGREEKRVQAHHGAVITLQWNFDGSALVTGGEDGAIKIWSRSGNLRATIAQTAHPVYALVWGPDNDAILYSSGRDLVIKQTNQVGSKQLQWKAHDGVVMKVDWNIINNLIVSGGEDCIYRVWDSYGRQLYQSKPFDYVITAVSWAPSGELFAVGAYNILRLCDKTGWSYCRDRPASGSIMDISWTTDGTQLAAAGGNGAVVFAQLIERQLEWNNVEMTLLDANKIRVHDVYHETSEELDFPRDRVIEMSLSYGYLVVATATQCFIYNTSNLNTPHIFDVRDTVNLIVQSERHFIMVDNFNGVQVYTYEGRALGTLRFAGLRPEFMNRKNVGLSHDAVAILDRTDCKVIRLFEPNGRPIHPSISHTLEIVELAVSQYTGSPASDRAVCFIDRNRDLYIVPVRNPAPHMHVKLYTQVDSMCWNDCSDMLSVVADEKLLTWYYPNVVYVDRDLLSKTCLTSSGKHFGKIPSIVSFWGNRCTLRRADGSLLTSAVPPYPAMLYNFVVANEWKAAVRLCRFVKNDDLWGTLAAMAINGKDLATAELSLAAIGEVDKLHYIVYIKDIPSEEGRNAELALYRRQPDEAERILLQANPPLVYRAIKMNIRLFRWERALDLALEKKTHVDTVLGYRQKYLEAFGKTEQHPKMLQYMQGVELDWDSINLKKQQEKENEKNRAEQ